MDAKHGTHVGVVQLDLGAHGRREHEVGGRRLLRAVADPIGAVARRRHAADGQTVSCETHGVWGRVCGGLPCSWCSALKYFQRPPPAYFGTEKKHSLMCIIS